MNMAIYSGFTHDLPMKNGGSVRLNIPRLSVSKKNMAWKLETDWIFSLSLGPAGDCTW
jgi:hypothetical protein